MKTNWLYLINPPTIFQYRRNKSQLNENIYRFLIKHLILKTFTIPFLDEKNNFYFFERYTGNLLVKCVPYHSYKAINSMPLKIANSVKYCESPYLLKTSVNHEINIKSNNLLLAYANALIMVCKFSFVLARIISAFAPKVFDTTNESIHFFRTNFQNLDQEVLCLPRAIFSASTSKSFVNGGSIFIGVFLPSKSMHAWIIENGTQPDVRDKAWIRFRPIAAMYYE